MTLDVQRTAQQDIRVDGHANSPPEPSGRPLFQTMDGLRVGRGSRSDLKQRGIYAGVAVCVGAAAYGLLYLAIHFAF